LRGVLLDVRGLQATSAGIGSVHTPFGEEFGLVQAGAGAFVQQELGSVEADAACADQRHGFSHGLLVAQHVQVAQHLGVFDAFDRGHARCHAGGQHHVRRSQRPLTILCADLVVQL